MKQEPPRRPGGKAPGAFALSLALAACGAVSLLSYGCAPRAVAIQGEAAEAVRRGIRSGQARFDHASFGRVLTAYTREMGTRFDYDGLKAHPQDLDIYLKAVAAADLPSLSRDELLALLINAYNASTLASIVESFDGARPHGASSIRDIPGVFSRRTHRVGGYPLSLDDLEHGLIRPLFKDPRIHFVVNCAARSCAPLPLEALTGANLESQLEDAARRTLSSPQYVRIEKGRLRVTRLLDWYGADFVTEGFHGAGKSLPGYLRRYAAEEVAGFIDAAGGDPPYEFLDYDWSLNRATSLRLEDPPPRP